MHKANSTVNMCQPKKEQEYLIIKPPHFYMSLVVINNLVHNFMIDYGFSTAVVPKNITNILRIEYKLTLKGILQINESTVQILCVFNDLELTLHACPVLIIT